MGRRIPSNANLSIHPAVSLTLLAALIAVIASLCGIRTRKWSSRAPSVLSEHKIGGETQAAATTIAIENSTERTTTPRVQEKQKPFSTLKAKETSVNNFLTISASERKLSISLSMKLPGGALVRYRSRKEQPEQPKPAGDSIWTKTIILGERCKVPNEDDAIIYDDKGNRIAAYPSRTPRSLPVSRTNSFINPDTIPSILMRIEQTPLC